MDEAMHLLCLKHSAPTALTKRWGPAAQTQIFVLSRLKHEQGCDACVADDGACSRESE